MLVINIVAKKEDSYKVEDQKGNTMQVSLAQLLKAYKDGSIQITNATIENDKVILNDEQEVLNLVNKLNKARKVYEQGQDEIMTNKEYDALYDKLEELERKTGLIVKDSPTQNVGYEVVSKLEKYTFYTPMLSLSKTKEVSELVSFLGDKEGVLSTKMDGLTVVVIYNNGVLEKAITRGNGEVGEIVTNNAKQFINLPKHINYLGKLILRGEAIMRYSDFKKINTSGEYKNPRNLCSGSVRQLDSRITAERNIYWFAFNVVEGIQCNSFTEQMNKLKELGFDVVEHIKANRNNIAQLVETFTETVKKSDIPADGLVLTYDDIKYGVSLGNTMKSPRHSIAFKWSDEEVISRIRKIEWRGGRTGVYTPVAWFDPVDIEGSTVQKASVHNVSIFHNLKLGYRDRVSIYKANMIIPQISDNLDRTDTCEIPSECPDCGHQLYIHEDPNSGVLTLFCENTSCPAKNQRSLAHFVSRDAMNIEGISKKTLETLQELGIVYDYISIFHIREHSEIMSIEGFGRKSFDNMVASVDKAREIKLGNFIYALGIPNIGLATAKLIAKTFDFDVVKALNAKYEQLVNIEGIGDVIAESYVRWLQDDDNIEQVKGLLNEVRFIHETATTDNSMKGVVICVTGAVEIFPNRDMIKQIVESKGGKLTGSVSRSTTYLVTNDTTSGSRKNRAAQEFGILILTEKEFIDKFNISI